MKKHLEGLGLNFSQKVSMEIADAVLKMSATKCTIKRRPPSDQRLDYTYISSRMLRNKRIQGGTENVHSYQQRVNIKKIYKMLGSFTKYWK